LRWLSRLGSPAVKFLSFSTDLVLKLLPVRRSSATHVTEDEIKVLIAEGTRHGTFEEAEQQLVEGVFRLGDRRIAELMRPKARVEWLDVNEERHKNWDVIRSSEHSRFPVAEGDLDHVLGVVHVKDLFLSMEAGVSIDLRKLARKPLFVPETIRALQVLERFQESGNQMAFIIDEHGGIEGIVTISDLLHAIAGDLQGAAEPTGHQITRRDDGSWVADGSLPVRDLLEELELREMVGDEVGFTTVAGLILAHLNRIPAPGDQVEIDGWRFGVLGMDGNRIDKVEISEMLAE
jgi:putative hemolysin